MSEPFQPYHEWLGLPLESEHPDYFQLLGLSPTETDERVIAGAADRAMNRVRSIRPGAHAAAWARLLDELREAKRCLTDPERRAAYAADLAAAGAAGPEPQRQEPRPQEEPWREVPAASPAANSAPAAQPMQIAPPMAIPAQDAGPAAQVTGVSNPAPQAADPMAPFQSPVAPSDYVAPPLGSTAPPPNAAANFHAPTAPTGPDPMAPFGAVASANPMSPVGVASPNPMAPVGRPVPSEGSTETSAIPVGKAVGVAAASPAAPVRSSSSTASRARKRKRSSTPVIVGTGAVFVMVMIAALLYALSGPEKDRELAGNSGGGQGRANSATGQDPSRPVSRPQDTPATTPETPPTVPGPVMPVEPETPDPEPPGMTPMPETPPATTPDTPTPEPPTTPDPDPPKPEVPKPEVPQPDPPEPTPPQTAAELAALSEAMRTARVALSEQNFDEANEWLAKAQPLAKTPDQLNKWDRLKMLAHYAGEYRRVLDNVLAGFEAGATINITESTQVAVVEVADDRIVLRVAGTNKAYPRNDLPLGLGAAIADQYFAKDDPVSLVLKGAFVALHKRTTDEQLQEVRQWWQQAIQQGVDIKGLLPVLEDNYDFVAAAPQPE